MAYGKRRASGGSRGRPNKVARVGMMAGLGAAGSAAVGYVGKKAYEYATRAAAKKVSQAAQAAVKRATSYVKTRYQKRRGINSKYGASSSKSAGFIRSRRRTYKRKSPYETLGVVKTIEVGGVLDAGANTDLSGNTVFVGHSTIAQDLCSELFWLALIKHLAIKAGIEELQRLNVSPPWFETGDKITLSYNDGPSGSLTTLTYTKASLETLEDAAAYFASWAESTNNSEIMLGDIALVPGGTNRLIGYTRMNLRTARVHMYCKSTQKIQNRTINSTGGDEESVDNVPLYGRSYEGNGNGAVPKTTVDSTSSITTNAARFPFCDVVSGTLAKVPTDRFYQEVLAPSHFINVKKFGKLRVEPGYIKTSALYSKKSMSVQSWFRMLYYKAQGSHMQTFHGKYRLMMLEKMINAVTGTTVNSIKVAYETNNRTGLFITTYKNTYTAPLNSVANISTSGE